ncbi:hypothetical protein KIW84_070657 [Lathyrus oleraceus]|uniref:Pectin acetylesterase n=1 Tax=Pisum sativum TaxID=3888 RepID=A0A9D4VI18_PEA|nr:hypothetical protein KIW84_070657 [Pisum sativum]
MFKVQHKKGLFGWMGVHRPNTLIRDLMPELITSFNPDVYNWNRIKVRFRDGSSFTSCVKAVDSATNLHYRGGRIFVIEDLQAKRIKNAKNTILSRCSAEEWTSILQCDSFRTSLPAAAEVKCVPGAGYLINAKAVSGAQHIEQFCSQDVQTDASTKNLPSSCIKTFACAVLLFAK